MQKIYSVCRNVLMTALAALILTAPITAVKSFAASITDIADPTRPTGYRPQSSNPAQSYRLESILLGSGRKVAIINGSSFNEGDNTKLGKLVAINADRVIIQGEKRHVLKLIIPSFKKRAEK